MVASIVTMRSLYEAVEINDSIQAAFGDCAWVIQLTSESYRIYGRTDSLRGMSSNPKVRHTSNFHQREIVFVSRLSTFYK